jgi:hypothetical protein
MIANPFSGLADFLGKGIDKFWPNKDTEIQTHAALQKLRMAIEAEIEKSVAVYADKHKEKLLEDVEGARDHEYRMAFSEPLIVRLIAGLLRASLRPIIGYLTMGSYSTVKFLMPLIKEQPVVLSQYDYGLLFVIVTFYFGGRTIEKVMRRKG